MTDFNKLENDYKEKTEKLENEHKKEFTKILTKGQSDRSAIEERYRLMINYGENLMKQGKKHDAQKTITNAEAEKKEAMEKLKKQGEDVILWDEKFRKKIEQDGINFRKTLESNPEWNDYSQAVKKNKEEMEEKKRNRIKIKERNEKIKQNRIREKEESDYYNRDGYFISYFTESVRILIVRGVDDSNVIINDIIVNEDPMIFSQKKGAKIDRNKGTLSYDQKYVMKCYWAKK